MVIEKVEVEMHEVLGRVGMKVDSDNRLCGLKLEDGEFEEVLSVVWDSRDRGSWKWVEVEENQAIVGVAIDSAIHAYPGLGISCLGFIMASRDNAEPEKELPAPTEMCNTYSFGDERSSWYRQFPQGTTKITKAPVLKQIKYKSLWNTDTLCSI